MKTESAAYAEARVKLAQQPVYVAQPYHVVRSGRPAEWPFSRGFASGAVAAATRDYLDILGRPSGNTQTVVPEEGQSSIGTFTLPLQDQDGEVLRYLSNPRALLKDALSGVLADRPSYIEATTSIGGYPAIGTLQIGAERVRYRRRHDASNRFMDLEWAVDATAPTGHIPGDQIQNGEQIRAGQRIQLLAGYRDIDERSFLRFAKMEITGVTLSNDGVSYLVTLADIQKFIQRLVFPATQDAPIIIEGHPIDIALRMLLSTGTATISTGTVQLLRPNIVQGVGTDFRNLARAGDVLVVAPFTSDERVLTVTFVESGTRLYVQETIAADSAAGLDYRRAGEAGTYDLFAGSWSVAMPSPFVDIAGLEALREATPTARMRFRLNGPEDAKTFFETELLKPMNCYPVITQDGAYSARVYEGRAGTPAATLDEDQIIGWSWQGGEERIINQVEVQYDWNETTAPNMFGLRQRYTANGSVEKYGLRQPFKMAAKGLRSDLGVQTQLDRWAFELFQRYSDSAPRLQLIVRYGNHVIDIGETVAVTHPRIPNRATGMRGLIAEPFQVRDVRPMFGAEGKVVMTLIQVSVLEAVDQPVGEPVELARTNLVIQRATYFNAASLALSTDLEDVTGFVTVTATSPTDTLHISARQYLTSATHDGAPTDVIGRIRVGSTEGLLLDGIMPASFLATTATKTTVDRYARRGFVKHELTYKPNAIGAITIVMSAYCLLTGAAARDRSLVVAVERI